MNCQFSITGHAKLLYFKYIALISHLHYYEVQEVFAYGDGQFQITDHGIEIIQSYIFRGCMKYVMEACFEYGVEVVVLDRPNPLGGIKMAGPSMDKSCMSYVGAFQIPFVHGMTIGELALWSKKVPGVLNTDEENRKLDL